MQSDCRVEPALGDQCTPSPDPVFCLSILPLALSNILFLACSMKSTGTRFFPKITNSAEPNRQRQVQAGEAKKRIRTILSLRIDLRLHVHAFKCRFKPIEQLWCQAREPQCHCQALQHSVFLRELVTTALIIEPP